MIVGGDYDPLVPIVVQDRDYEILSQNKKKVKYLRMNNIGHESLWENPDCVLREVNEFLDSSSMNIQSQKVGCSSP